MKRHRILIFAAATLAAALWASSCGDGTTEPPPDPPRPTTVTVTPATAELTALDATVQLNAQVLDQYGQVMAGASLTWSSGAASVAVTSFEPRTPGVRAYLTQAVQSHDFAVPLVAGEDALLRVFVVAGDGVTASMPPVRARFYQGEREVHSAWIDGSSGPVPHTMAEGDLEATANALIPGEFVVPGTEMVVDVEPNGTLDPSLGIGGRIPEEGRMALGIRSVPDFDVTAVPFLWAEDPDSSGLKATIGLTADHDAFYETREWLPTGRMTATVREPVLVDYDPKENMHLVLGDVRLLLVADGAPGYYMAVPPWKDSGVLGIAFLDSRASVSRFEGHTIAHEFGHNFLLRHAPCGGPAGADGQYPHSGGRIGAWGFDFRDFPIAGTVTLFSRGIPGAAEWRR